jgi:class 3 adenylate cyclase/tetratricopeptide (TPR) repeat protein
MVDQKRKLAAIVFTDIVGFTKLTAKDQTLASTLLTQQRDAFKPIVESHGGTWLKEMGDGLLLIFDTVTDAVECCIKIQEEALKIEEMVLRIGIHQGEILMLENDVIGDDVNVASRIEAFSAPGGIAISGKVYDAIVREMHYKTKYLGRPKLKGVGQDVTVYCIISHGLPETNLSDISAKLEQTRSKFFYPGIASLVLLPILLYFFLFRADQVDSIAVLYMDVGSDPELSYLEAITEDLIFDLTSSSQGLIKVSEPAEVKKYKEGSSISVDDVANELGVDFVFWTQIQQDGSGFKFRYRLYDSDAQKDRFLKTDYIEKNSLQSILGVLISKIVDELDIEQSEQFARVEYDPESYNLYLQAKSLYTLAKSAEDNDKAISMMEEAISKDANLVMAQIYLGTMQYDLGNYAQASAIYERALSKSKSLQDNASMAESLRKQGQLLRKKKDYAASIVKFSEALSMSTVMNDKSSMAKTLNSMAILNWKTREKDEALKNWLQALSIVEELEDKPKISKYLNNIGIWYRDDSDYSKSVEYYQKSLTIKEDLGDVRNIGKTLNNIGNVYFMMGDYENSVEHYGRSVDIKEKLQDNKGLASTLNNIGETYFYQANYDDALLSFRKSSSYGKDDDNIFDNERYIGMSHYYLGNYDSCKIYLKRADEYFSSSQVKRLAILPYLIVSYKKTGDAKNSDDLLQKFKEIAQENDAEKKDFIIANWASYEALDFIGQSDKAREFLENAYFEIKSRSRDIKNKSDRNKYLAANLHDKITKAWNSK